MPTNDLTAAFQKFEGADYLLKIRKFTKEWGLRQRRDTMSMLQNLENENPRDENWIKMLRKDLEYIDNNKDKPWGISIKEGGEYMRFATLEELLVSYQFPSN